MMLTSFCKYGLIALLGTSLFACSDNTTQTTSTTSVKARQDLMQDWRHANEVMKGMLENPASFDSATFQEQVQAISGSTAQMWAHFTDVNDKGKSQETVWSDATGFQAKQQEFDTALHQLITISATAKTADDVQKAFGAMAESCGGCHKLYKQ